MRDGEEEPGEPDPEKFMLTLEGEGLTSSPEAGQIDKDTEVTVTVTVPAEKEIESFKVNDEEKKDELTDNKYTFNITEDTAISVIFKDITEPEDPALTAAKQAVEKAEGSQKLADKKAAQILVAGLEDGTEKTELQSRLSAITEIKVANEAELKAALDEGDIATIVLESKIVANLVEINRAVKINGDDNTLEGKVIIYANDVVLKDLTVDLNMSNPNSWLSGSYAVQVYKAKDVTLNNVTLKNANAGLLVNGSEVTLKGTIDVSENGFGGIEVSKGADDYPDPKLTVNGTLTFTGENLPAIWIDGTTENNGWVVGSGFESMETTEADQVWFKVN